MKDPNSLDLSFTQQAGLQVGLSTQEDISSSLSEDDKLTLTFGDSSQIQAQITDSKGLTASLTEEKSYQAALDVGSIGTAVYPMYVGQTQVRPSVKVQTFNTAWHVLRSDFKVQAIPYFETSNLQDGITAVIGDT